MTHFHMSSVGFLRAGFGASALGRGTNGIMLKSQRTPSTSFCVIWRRHRPRPSLLLRAAEKSWKWIRIRQAFFRQASMFWWRHPVAAASIAFSLKYGAADTLAQALQGQGQAAESDASREHKTTKDTKDTTINKDRQRTILFFLFGALYGGFNYYVFRTYTRIPLTNASGRAVAMTAIDTVLHLPFVFMPSFYCARAAISSPTGDFGDGFGDGRDSGSGEGAGSFSLTTQLGAVLSLGIADWRSNFLGDLRNIWLVWIPINLVCFRCVPLHLRTPFVATFGFAYPCILSVTRGSV